MVLQKNRTDRKERKKRSFSISFSIILSKEHPGLMSFRMDWLDLLVVQGTLKSLLQHHSSKASILQRSAFFTVQLSHPYMTTGKAIALIRRTLVGKVMSLLFNILSSLITVFLLRSKHLLISWLQSPYAVIWEPKKIKSDTISTVFPSSYQPQILRMLGVQREIFSLKRGYLASVKRPRSLTQSLCGLGQFI